MHLRKASVRGIQVDLRWHRLLTIKCHKLKAAFRRFNQRLYTDCDKHTVIKNANDWFGAFVFSADVNQSSSVCSITVAFLAPACVSVEWGLQLQMVLWTANSSHYFPIWLWENLRQTCRFSPLGFALFQHPLFTSLPRSACLYPISDLRSPPWPSLPLSLSLLPPGLLPSSVAYSLVYRFNSFTRYPPHALSIHPSSINSPTPWSDLPSKGLCVTDEWCEWAKGVGGRMSERVGIRA